MFENPNKAQAQTFHLGSVTIKSKVTAQRAKPGEFEEQNTLKTSKTFRYKR